VPQFFITRFRRLATDMRVATSSVSVLILGPLIAAAFSFPTQSYLADLHTSDNSKASNLAESTPECEIGPLFVADAALLGHEANIFEMACTFQVQ
jgi:hypothetical protein